MGAVTERRMGDLSIFVPDRGCRLPEGGLVEVAASRGRVSSLGDGCRECHTRRPVDSGAGRGASSILFDRKAKDHYVMARDGPRTPRARRRTRPLGDSHTEPVATPLRLKP